MRNTQVLASLTSKVAEISKGIPTISMQSFVRIPDSDAFKITCSYATSGKFNEVVAERAIVKHLDSKFALVAGTMMYLENTRLPAFTAIIKANTISKPYNDESVKGMHVISANVMDDGANIWKVVGDNDNRRLVQVSEDNLEEILASRRSKTVIQASIADTIDFNNGDYVFYYNPKMNKIHAGFAIHTENGDIVYDRHTNATNNLTNQQIVAAVIVPEKDKRFDFSAHLVQAKMSASDANAILNYYKTLYEGTDFYAKLEQQVNKERTAAEGVNTMSI